MPYTIRKGGGSCGSSQYAVLVRGTGRTMGCHDTHAQAVDQVAALNANEAREAAVPEALQVNEATTSLSEAAVADDGTVNLRLIAPGWSENGRYYPADVLRRDGPSVFTEGLHTYVDHPRRSDEVDRPERSVRDLAGSLTETARWQDDGPAGPGLYAPARVADAYRPLVDELADDIGVSIRAEGMGERGEAEGRQGMIVSELTSAESVDYVTRPSAGGEVLQLIESVQAQGNTVPSGSAVLTEARNAGHWLEAFIHQSFTERADFLFGEGLLSRDERIALSTAIGEALQAFNAAVERDAPGLYDRDPFQEPDPVPTDVTEAPRGPQGGTAMPEPTSTSAPADLTEATSRISALEAERDQAVRERDQYRDAQRLREATDAVSQAVQAVEIPDRYASVAESIRERASQRVQVSRDESGAISRDALAEAARREVNAEVEQLTKLAEAAGVGQPNGVGGNGDGNGPTPEEATTKLTESFQGLGMSPEAAKAAATAR